MKEDFTTTNNGGEDVKDVPSIVDKRKLFPGDRVLGIIIVMFFAISTVVVYSASSILGFRDGSTNIYLQKHLGTLAICAGLIVLCYIISARLMRHFTLLAYIVSWLMTLAPYFVGGATNSAHRWLDLGFVKFQPSELLKIGTVMLLAAQLSKLNERIKRVHMLPSTFDVRQWGTTRERKIFREEIIPIVAPIALSCGVILPAHFSSAFHLFIISLGILFIAGVHWKELFKFTAVAGIVGAVALTAMTLAGVGRGATIISRFKKHFNVENTQKESAKSIFDKYDDTDRSRMAIYNGGIFGVGAGRSLMRARLTHPESDYLFAIMVEEFGLLLSFIIILLYLWLFFRALRIFEKCEWLYAGLLAVGLALLITSQGFLHIAVATGIIPETGQNLPFLTQGRTGMFCASIAVGIILSISRQVETGRLVPPSMQSKNGEI